MTNTNLIEELRKKGLNIYPTSKPFAEHTLQLNDTDFKCCNGLYDALDGMYYFQKEKKLCYSVTAKVKKVFYVSDADFLDADKINQIGAEASKLGFCGYETLEETGDSVIYLRVAERQAAENEKQEYLDACKKWERLMTPVDENASSRQRLATARKNILAMCKKVAPSVKFSCTYSKNWGCGFTVSWDDGISKEELEQKTDLSLFVKCYETFCGYDDSTDVVRMDFTDFAEKYGNFYGKIALERNISEDARKKIGDVIFQELPQFKQFMDKWGCSKITTKDIISDFSFKEIARKLNIDYEKVNICKATRCGELYLSDLVRVYGEHFTNN